MNEIYKITNSVTGKSYIGITSQGYLKRFRVHKSEAKRKKYDTYLHRSIRKYGEENFTIEVLENHEDRYIALSAEIRLIRELKTLQPDGYNQHEGGRGGFLNPSQEVREKLSKAKLGNIPHNKGKGKIFPEKVIKEKVTLLKTCGSMAMYSKGCRCSLCVSENSRYYKEIIRPKKLKSGKIKHYQRSINQLLSFLDKTEGDFSFIFIDKEIPFGYKDKKFLKERLRKLGLSYKSTKGKGLTILKGN